MVLRSLTQTKAVTASLLDENPSSELVQRILSSLEMWRETLYELKDLDNRLLDLLDEEENL